MRESHGERRGREREREKEQGNMGGWGIVRERAKRLEKGSYKLI
jgi:hypothetical protein